MKHRRLLDRYRGATAWTEETTVIGPRFTLVGAIITDGSVVIAGRVEGPVRAAELVHVLPGAVVLGGIAADAAVIDGAVEGDIEATEELELGHTGRVRGALRAAQVAVAEGSYHVGMLESKRGPVMQFRERRKLRR